jgi:hypothetical protein
MDQPLNYALDVQTPFAAAMSGYSAGAAIRNDQQQQADRAQAQIVAEQQRQAQVALQQEVASVFGNPTSTATDVARLIAKVPGSREAFSKAWEIQNTAQQDTTLSNIGQWGYAIKAGRPELAVDAMNARADAMERTSGGPTPESQQTRLLANITKEDPKFALGKMLALLETHPDGERVAKTRAALGVEQRAEEQAPSDLKKKEADATKAAVDARIALQTAPAAVEKPSLDNEEVRQRVETAKAQRRIAELDTQIKQANSETERGRLVLERDKLTAEMAKTQQAQAQGAQDTMDGLTQAIGTVQALKTHPGLTKGTGAGGDWMAWFNGSDAADFRAMVDTLKSQQFLAQAKQMSGMGALSDAEGARLERAVASLDTRQSAEQFKTNLSVVESLLNKGQATGEAFVLQHPTFGAVKEGDINRLLAQHPGATREQVIQYLSRPAAPAPVGSSGASGGY